MSSLCKRLVTEVQRKNLDASALSELTTIYFQAPVVVESTMVKHCLEKGLGT